MESSFLSLFFHLHSRFSYSHMSTVAALSPKSKTPSLTSQRCLQRLRSSPSFGCNSSSRSRICLSSWIEVKLKIFISADFHRGSRLLPSTKSCGCFILLIPLSLTYNFISSITEIFELIDRGKTQHCPLRWGFSECLHHNGVLCRRRKEQLDYKS